MGGDYGITEGWIYQDITLLWLSFAIYASCIYDTLCSIHGPGHVKVDEGHNPRGITGFTAPCAIRVRTKWHLVADLAQQHGRSEEEDKRTFV